MVMVLEDFIDYIRVHKRYSPRTQLLYREYAGELYEFIAPANEQEFLSELKPQVIRGFIASGLENGLSPRSMNLKLSAISSFCNFLVRRGIIESNPVRKVFRPKMSARLPEFYTENNMENYFAKPVEDGDFLALRDRTMVSLIYSTGIRRAELASLRIKDWDRDRSLFRITGKGDKQRDVPVPRPLEAELKVYTEMMNDFYGENPSGMMFLTDTGQPLYLSFVNKVVKRELEKAPGFSGKKSPHMLRHSIATHLLNNGADLNSIKEVLGHSSLAATQVYTHNSFEKLKSIFLTAHPRAKKGG